MTENKVVASGRVVRIRRLPNGSAVVMLASKASKMIFPSFTVPSGAWEKLRVRDRVHVEGHVETYLANTKAGKVKKQKFTADTIGKEPTLTEDYFGIKGKFYPEMYVRVYLRGEITGMTDTKDGWLHYVIAVDGDNDRRESFVKVNHKKPEYGKTFDKGDKICAVCGVTTAEKEKDGKQIKYEDICVLDIAGDKENTKQDKEEKVRVDVEPIF